MPPALKALLAQLAGWLIALTMVRSGVVPAEPVYLLGTQALAACVSAALLRSAWWWLPIHLAFSPLLVFANQAGIPPYWYLALFILLTIFYWTSFRTQVPLYLSNASTVAAVLEQLPSARPIRMLDLGSGTGTLLIPLARSRADCQFIGIEAAPAPFLLSRLNGRGLANLHFERGDFFKIPWQQFDLVYAFLSPVPMRAVWNKAVRELGPEARLISNSFPVPNVEPEAVIEVGDNRATRLFVYRPGRHRVE